MTTPKEDSRAAIVHAAVASVRERGWEATSMQEVRLRAGVSNGSLFHHFPTRRDLEAAVVAAALGDHQALVRTALESASGARDGVRDVVLAHLGWIADERRLALLLLSALPGALLDMLTTTVVERHREFFAVVETWLQRHGWDGDPDLLVLNSLWLGPANDYARGWLTTGRSDPDPETASVLADGAWHAMRPHLREDQ